MNENLRRFAAASILTVTNAGVFEATIAQAIASVIEAGSLAGDETIDYISGVFLRVSDLLNKREVIWDELLPGPVRDEPKWDGLMSLLDSISAEGAERLVSTSSDAKSDVTLTYPVKIVRSVGEGTEILTARGGCQVFQDEMGVQWVKFVPQNGYHSGQEHIVRTDSPGFAIVRNG